MFAFLSMLAIGVAAVGIGLRNKRAKEAAKLQLEKDIWGLKRDIAGLTGDIATTKTAIAETEMGIADIGDWLGLYPAYAEKEKTQMEQAGRREYETLMENYGMMNVLAGATGRVGAGTSMAVAGGQARGKVAGFVGEDLTFDPEGGFYGMAWAELLQNLGAEYTGKERQLDVLETSLSTLGEAQTGYEEALSEAEQQLAIWELELNPPKKPGLLSELASDPAFASG